MEKPIGNWDYEELVAHCAWVVIDNLTRGVNIRSSMMTVIQLVLEWKAEKDGRKR